MSYDNLSRPLRQASRRSFEALFPGRCAKCGRAVCIGERVHFLRTGARRRALVHVGCVAPAAC